MKITLTQFRPNTAEAVWTDCFAQAIAELHKAGGGVLTVPTGEYSTGPIELCSNMELHLEPGAVIRFLNDPAAFPLQECQYEGRISHRPKPCLSAFNAENVALTGSGVLDGCGAPWWAAQRARTLANGRPYLLHFENVTHLRVCGVQLRNSPAWTVHPLNCVDVLIEDVSICNPYNSPNTDGINPESCRDVRILNCSVDMPYASIRTYYSRVYEAKFITGAIAAAVAREDRVGYVAANPVYGIPAAVNAYAQGLKTVRPDAKVVLRWACLCDAAHPQDFSDRKDIEVFYSQDFREPEGTYRDYGLCRRLPDGVLQPLGLPEWRWDVFFTEIVRSVFAGTWDSAPGGRAINYWWGLKSGAERVEYPTRLNDGTMQLLKMAERQLCDGEIQVFPTESYSQGHALHHAASGIYTPKELMEMDWLEECVEGELPSYDELDAKTRSLLNINGLDNVKGTPQ